MSPPVPPTGRRDPFLDVYEDRKGENPFHPDVLDEGVGDDRLLDLSHIGPEYAVSSG